MQSNKVVLNVTIFSIFLCIILTSPGISQSSDSTRQDKKDKVYISTFLVDNPPVFSHHLNLDFQTWIQKEFNSRLSLTECMTNIHLVIDFTVSASGFVENVRITQKKGSVFDDKIISKECLDGIKTMVKKSNFLIKSLFCFSC